MRNERQTVEHRELVAYLEGDVTPCHARDIEGRLSSCAASRRCLEDLRRIVEAVAGKDEASVDLVARVRDATAKPDPEPVSRGWHWRALTWPAIVGLAAAGTAFLLLLPLGNHDRHDPWPAESTREQHRDSLFRVKAAGSTGNDPWVDLRVYHVHEERAAQPVNDEVPRDAGLLFAYTNLGPQPYDYLMVFAVGPNGHVYWFYPAYERSGTNPASIPIERGQALVELPDLIRHALQPGMLTVYGLFSRTPLRVLAVEALLRRRTTAPREGMREGERLPLADTGQRVVRIRAR